MFDFNMNRKTIFVMFFLLQCGNHATYLITPNHGSLLFTYANLGQHHSPKKIFLGFYKNFFHKLQ